MFRLSLSFFLLPLLGFSQEPAKSLLWKIDGNGLAQPSYVVGTVHSRDARAFVRVDQWLGIIKKVDVVAGELDLTISMDNSAELAVAMMLPPGKELSDLYTKKEFIQVSEALQINLGSMAILTTRMRPFFLLALLGETAMAADSALVLDQYLQVKGKQMGKQVMGLETIQEQLRAVDDLPLQEQAAMLYEMITHDLYRKEMDEMMDAYAAQDLSELTKIAIAGGMPDAFNTRLVEDRNRVMAHRMDSLMHSGRTFFFAVGAAHLTNATGVIQALRDQGYRVEAVREKAVVPDRNRSARTQ